MDVLRKKLIKGIPYFIIKLAGAGFLMFVISSHVLLASGLDMYEFVEGIDNLLLWIIVFGYGIFYSLFIDLIVFRFSKTGYIMICKFMNKLCEYKRCYYNCLCNVYIINSSRKKAQTLN